MESYCEFIFPYLFAFNQFKFKIMHYHLKKRIDDEACDE